MNIVQIEESVKNLVINTESGDLSQSEFIYELLLAYGHRKQSVTRLRTGERNLARDEANTVFWKRHLYFKVETSAELHGVIDAMRKEARTDRHKIRFVIATDFNLFLAIDTKTGDTLDIEFKDLAKKFDFFLPWAGMEKAVYQGENPADVKAAEKLAKLFDEIKADNFDSTSAKDPAKLHELNVFLSRLLFCFFAEDTEIFEDGQFSSAIASHTRDDGSDLSDYLKRLFAVLNQPKSERPGLPDYLSDFPYVNGGLFKDDIEVPTFNRKSRKILIECGAELDWSDINPDIFGSMFQAVVHTEQRSNMGQHYTSVPNIMKVIEPLFLNDLYEELDKHQDSQKKLLELQQRIGKIKIFDPACGSGNFLIIAYKELRKLEMEILKRLQELEFEKSGQMFKPFSVIQLSQFYGIEIDDFAHEIAILSLWLTEHQMNVAFKDEFGESLPSLPLKNGGNVVSGNAAQEEWENVCGFEGETYLIGNPPYLGARQQSKKQKSDIEACLRSVDGFKNLDYISIWFLKAAELIKKFQGVSAAFVSTNSITQGTQVNLLWPTLLEENVEIGFAYTSFKWSNSARANAGVTCVIVGLRAVNDNKPKFIFDELNQRQVKRITPYLTEGETVYISQCRSPISPYLPSINYGSFALDDGALTLSKDEALEIESNNIRAKNLVRQFIGAKELLQGGERYCLWLSNENEYSHLPLIKKRVEHVQKWRSESDRKSTVNLAKTPYRFAEIRQPDTDYLAFPTISSENREYIPVQFLSKEIIASNQIYVVPNAPAWLFTILGSAMHMAWIRSIGGKLESRIRYSSSLCYNTFPLPKLTESQQEKLAELAFNIVSLREQFSDKSLAKLYDPEKMPTELKTAHQNADNFVDEIFQHKGIASDESRMETLLKHYKQVYGGSDNA